MYNLSLTLNLLAHRNSNASEVRQQILTTRLYIGCLAIFTLILASITLLDQRMTTIIVSRPTITEFEDLYQSGKLPHSCPCSQIAIPHSEFISVIPTNHEVCSSQLISDDWLDRLAFRNYFQAVYYLDVRSYGLDMLRTVRSFCLLANETIIDALTNFLAANLISTQMLSRQQFHEQTEALIVDFQSNVENTFKQVFSIARQTNQGDQVLTSKRSNFFFDGLFDSSGLLIDVRTFTGIKSSINDTLPSCSCVLNNCSQPLSLFDYNNDSQIFTLIADIPGMYSACYALDGLRMSTFECWFNQSCIELILSHLIPFPIEIYFQPLNSSMLSRSSPFTTIGEIIDNLMIEMWRNITNYERYYNSCRLLTCTYTSYQRFDWLYTITIVTSIFGGLSVSLRIICLLLIKLYFYCRRPRSVPTSSKYFRTLFFNVLTIIDEGESAIVRGSIVCRLVNQMQDLLLTMNLFDSNSPHQYIQRRERLSTRLYINLLSITIGFLFVYMLFTEHTRTTTVRFPSSNLVAQLQKKYPMTISCPCIQTSMSYSTFLSLKVRNIENLAVGLGDSASFT